MNKSAYIKSLINKSVPIKDTIAETYLKNRVIKDINNTYLLMIKKKHW